jgi:hypothetical protein
VRAVLHAHPDRWTVGLGEHLPPEERTRLRGAVLAAAAELLDGQPHEIDEPDEIVEDTEEQREAIRRWRGRDPRDLPGTLAAAFDGVVSGAFWVAPAFLRGDLALSFHPGWRLVIEGRTAALPDLATLAARHGLLVRDR